MEKTSGEFCETSDTHLVSRFEWRVPRIKSVLTQLGDTCDSPSYEFCDAVWKLGLSRSVISWSGYTGLDIYVSRRGGACSHKNRVKYKIFIISSDGKEHLLTQDKSTADERIWRIAMKRAFFETDFSWVDDREIDLRFVCSLKCLECKPASQGVQSKCYNSLASDLMDLFISGEDSDMTINVKDRAFNVHKGIIRARSPVFFAMLKHDMVEKRNGRVDISDCEPEAFRRFLEYVYSGELKDASKDIVCSLYNIADKYQVLGAKARSVKLILQYLSVETFCDIATLAMRHEESEILDIAGQFFVENAQEIFETNQWLSLLKEDSGAANGLLVNLMAARVLHTSGILNNKKNIPVMY